MSEEDDYANSLMHKIEELAYIYVCVDDYEADQGHDSDVGTVAMSDDVDAV